MKKLWLITGLILVFACKKDSPDTQPPTIQINEPTNGEVFSAGAPILIEADVADNERLDEIHLTVINKASNDEIVHEHSSPNGATYMVSKTIVAVADITYKITIEAYDASGNLNTKTVEVTVE